MPFAEVFYRTFEAPPSEIGSELRSLLLFVYNVKGLDCEIFTKFLFSGTAPDSYKQKTPATRHYLPDYGCKGTKIFLYLPSTYYVRVLVLSSPDAVMIPRVRGIYEGVQYSVFSFFRDSYHFCGYKL